MKAKQRVMFPFSLNKKNRPDIQKDRIELVSCPLKDIRCKGHLSEVNESYLKSEQYLREKDFKSSIETLKSAFYKTTELIEHPCSNCAQLFRSTIIQSMENIHDELGIMSKGFFGNSRYQSSYISADNALKEFGNMRV